MLTLVLLEPIIDELLIDDLDVQMAGVLVEVPDIGVVAVGQSKSGHPVFLAAVAPPPRHQASDHCRRPHVKLQPLVD